jgi:hypothetical protein
MQNTLANKTNILKSERFGEKHLFLGFILD